MGQNPSEFSRKVQVLLEDKDKEGLIALLRQPEDPNLRAEVASALGELLDYDLTEPLVRSFLEDPEGTVRTAAHQALKELHGAQTETVIASYRSGPEPDDAWLEDENGEEDELEEDPQEGKFSQHILRLTRDKDIEGLTALLRRPDHPELRIEAAAALGNLLDYRATEPLVRSHLEDPEAAVRLAARRALETLHGFRAETVISSYHSNLTSKEPWLLQREDDNLVDDEERELDEEEFDEEGLDEDDLDEVDLDEITDDAGSAGSLAGDVLEGFSLDGLIQVATHEPNLEMRLKVIRLLSRSRSSRATDLLAYLALRAEDKALRQAAHQALEDQYGEETEKLLQGYRDEAVTDEFDEDELEDEFEDDSEDEDEEEFDEQEPRRSGSRSSFSIPPEQEYPVVEGQNKSEPVTQEMGFPWQVIGVIVIIAIGLVLVYLLLNGH